MQELDLKMAVLEGIHDFNRIGNAKAFKNHIALSNDFHNAFLAGNSGVIALPARSGEYDLQRFGVPSATVPDITFDDLWKCTKEHYGLTAAASISISSSIPLE